MKNTYARIMKLLKLLDCCGHRLAECRALYCFSSITYFVSVIINFLKRERWYDTDFFCVNCLIYFRGDCHVSAVCVYIW